MRFSGGKVSRDDMEIAAAAWLASGLPDDDARVRFDIIDMLVVTRTERSCGIT